MKDRKIIFRCRVGSHLYGLNTPESDEDFLSVFIPSEADILGIHKVDMLNASTKSSSEDRRNTKDDVDDVSYSLPKFLHLLVGNNPNVVETLFATDDNIIICEPEFRELMDNYDKLVSQKIFHSFTGYAYSQRKKLVTKRDRYNTICEGILKMGNYFTVEQLHSRKYAMTEEDSDWLNQNLDFYKNRDGNTNSFHKGMPLHVTFEMLKSERDHYGWRMKTDSFAKVGYDCKFGYHLIRIIAEGLELLETGKLQFPICGETKSKITRIRSTEVPVEELLGWYDDYDTLCKKAFESTSLRKKPDMKWADKYLIKTLKKSILED